MPSSAPATPISGNCRSGSALPKQTQNYVPIILALALVAKDPARYGVQVSPEKPPQTEAVNLDHSISLQLVADAIRRGYRRPAPSESVAVAQRDAEQLRISS